MYQSVLITGAAGFIGSHLVRRQVSLGRRVRALDIRRPITSWPSDPQVDPVVGDIADPTIQEKAVQGVDLIFHLASAHLAVNVSENTYWRVNVHSVPGFLERCRNAGVKRFVHLSSVGVYGNVENPPANEDHPCRPELLYERTKYQGELEVQAFFQKTCFPVTIVRPVWVYGPGCPRTLKLFKAIQKGRFFFVGNRKTLRHCVYIDDLLDALDLCAGQEAAVGKIYIIGDLQPVTLENLTHKIAAILDVRAPRLRLPVTLVQLASSLLQHTFTALGKEPPFSQRSLNFFTNNTAFDISRARTELGFVPKITLEEGLRLAYEAMIKAPTTKHSGNSIS